jgi:hypothetical protein
LRLSAAPSLGGQATAPTVAPSRLSLVRGEDRRKIIFESLRLIEDDVRAAVEGKKRVLVKPNMSVDKNPLAVTHIDAVRAVLDFLRSRFEKPLVVAESGVLNTADGFRNNGYFALEREYGVKVVDLNADPVSETWYVANTDHVPQAVRIYSAFVDPDVCVISVARMKTHDTVLVTLALKNVLMAAPVNDYRNNDKGILHGTTKSVDDIMHYNLFHLAKHGVWPTGRHRRLSRWRWTAPVEPLATRLALQPRPAGGGHRRRDDHGCPTDPLPQCDG